MISSIGQFNLDAIDRHFPKESYRDGQKECIEFALNAFNAGKKVVILECPTGSGKSAIGMTIADMVNRSYYLTSTKILQDQLTDDFGNQIVELKGRGSYPCTYWDRFGDKMVDRKLLTSTQLQEKREKYNNCANGFCKTSLNTHQNKFKCSMCFTSDGPVKNGGLTRLSGGKQYSECPYYEQVYQAIAQRKVVMNFSSFLFQTQMTKRFENPRDLLTVDECHNAEPQLMDFISLSLSDYHLQLHGLQIPQFDDPRDYAVWFQDNNVDAVLFDIMKQAENNDNTRLVDDISRILKKYKTFMEQICSNPESEWVCEYVEKYGGGRKYRTVILKPVYIRDFVTPTLFKFANRVLMMSATILDVNVFCNSLGINREHVAAYRMKNRFPVENRRIYIDPVGKLVGGKQRMHEWASPLVKKIDEIVGKYPDAKGIIHTHNFAIMDYILRHSSKSTKSRLLNQHDFTDKSELLATHAQSKNSVIIAPAMHEGIDLKDDLSRFQIIAKVPFANCFDDKQLARRVELDHKYYTWLTALRLIQSYGRSVRSETDYADTYILDESIYKFLKDAKKMIPDWFTEAIVD